MIGVIFTLLLTGTVVTGIGSLAAVSAGNTGGIVVCGALFAVFAFCLSRAVIAANRRTY